MSDSNVIPFPARPTAFDLCCERANRVVVGELLRAFDEGGEQAAEDMLHCMIWSAAEWSAKMIGASSTCKNFAMAGRYGYDRKAVRP